MSANPETSCLAITALAGCPKLMTDSELIKSLLHYSSENSAKGGDLRQSALVREITESPDSKPDQYRALLNACRLRYLNEMFKALSDNCATAAQGCFAQAMGAPKFEPMLFLPDNEFGQFAMRELVAMHEYLGILTPGQIKVEHIPAAKPEKKIITG